MVRNLETVPENGFAMVRSRFFVFGMPFAVVRGHFSVSERTPHHCKTDFWFSDTALQWCETKFDKKSGAVMAPLFAFRVLHSTYISESFL